MRGVILQEVTARASMLGRPVVLVTEDDLGQGQLLVHPDGRLEEHGEYVPTGPAPTAPVLATPAAAPAPEVTPPPSIEPIADAPATAPSAPTDAPAASAAPVAAPETRRAARQSFLTREEIEEPATQGLRGALARIGIRVSPSDAERLEREWTRLVSQHWPGPRTIVIVNGKAALARP